MERLRNAGFLPLDLVAAGWTSIVVVVVGALRSDILGSQQILVQHATWLLLFLAGVRICARTGASRTIHMLYRFAAMVALIPVSYLHMGDIVRALHPGSYELALQSIDKAVFGVDPVRYLERLLHPVAVDFFQVAYFSYFVLPFVVLVPVVAQGRLDRLEYLLTAAMLTLFASYVGYILVPARSPFLAASMPQFAHAFQFTREVHGSIVGDTIRSLLESWDEVELNAFPSCHTAMAVVYMLGVRGMKKTLAVVATMCTALILSTVYLRYHYVVDVVAGVGLAFATSWAASAMTGFHPGKDKGGAS